MKFFRKIRQKLIKSGNLKRYLLYAVGEILLVMIGISLAFRVDSWNEDRINKEAEIKYYQNIKDQISKDRASIENEMSYNDLHMLQFAYASEIVENDDRDKLDTLGMIARKLTNYSDFDRRGNIYETMVNSGEIKLLQNTKIVKGTRELEETYMHINRIENIHYDAMMRYAAPALSSTVKWSTGVIQKPEELYTYEFQNLIEILMQVMLEKDDTYKEALREIDLLTALINEELVLQ
ncbi:MAG: DUF6090 family protein [Flavobacteriaceae bacterium]